jgi:CheY-like chemotaxis protein
VTLAANAEDGLQLASELIPDLILLDHQLPGTTGFEVCRQLVQQPLLQNIPVVVSSTLRKRAYVEYTDLDNVVDMLPKPYTEELLRTTVANALETAAMIVASQSQGTAIPEVINQLGESSLAGTCSLFRPREVIDFLNNGAKQGCLEFESQRVRFQIFLQDGHIQGVAAKGLSDEQKQHIEQRLPSSLANLAPLLKMTLSGQGCAEVEGFVQLIDRKVLDPRLLSALLQYQSAMLLRLAFKTPIQSFRFDAGRLPADLYKRLPLDASLLSLLVEGALADSSDSSYIPGPEIANSNRVYARRAIRGQNLDRTGLSARHLKLLGVLSEPRSATEIARELQWDIDEVQRVLSGFMMSELVEEVVQKTQGAFVIYGRTQAWVTTLRAKIASHVGEHVVRCVKDEAGLLNLLRQEIPVGVLFDGDDAESCQQMQHAISQAKVLRQVKFLATSSEYQGSDFSFADGRFGVPNELLTVLPTWFTSETLKDALLGELAGSFS